MGGSDSQLAAPIVGLVGPWGSLHHYLCHVQGAGTTLCQVGSHMGTEGSREGNPASCSGGSAPSRVHVVAHMVLILLLLLLLLLMLLLQLQRLPVMLRAYMLQLPLTLRLLCWPQRHY